MPAAVVFTPAVLSTVVEMGAVVLTLAWNSGYYYYWFYIILSFYMFHNHV